MTLLTTLGSQASASTRTALTKTSKHYDAGTPTPPHEVMAALDAYMETNFGSLLPVDKCWQPSDLLPDLRSPDWLDEVSDFRRMAAALCGQAASLAPRSQRSSSAEATGCLAACL